MIKIAAVQKHQFKIFYRPGTADEAVLEESFDHDIFFPGTPEYHPKADHIIIDIGAHIGCFSLLAASKVPAGKVYSFEPAQDTYQLLKKNIQSNDFSNISSFQLAVAANNGAATLYHDIVTGNWGHSIVKRLSGDTEQVDCITLEDFINRENLSHIDFIKFNCEGSEFGIIMNTPYEVLQKVKCMLILYHGYLEDSITKEQMANYLIKAGFHIHYRRRNKDDDSGSMIAYRAGFMENIAVITRTIPLRISLATKEFKRKLRRLKQIVFKKAS